MNDVFYAIYFQQCELQMRHYNVHTFIEGIIQTRIIRELGLSQFNGLDQCPNYEYQGTPDSKRHGINDR